MATNVVASYFTAAKTYLRCQQVFQVSSQKQ